MFIPRNTLSTLKANEIKILLIGAYKNCLRIRRFEENAAKLYGQGLIGGFCHLYIGQEAIATGCEFALSKEDSIITSYRCHAQALLRSSMREVMCELLGRANGISSGKGGSMHMFDPANKFFGGHGIVGAQSAIGTGLAFANKYARNLNICVTLIGDGATNQGQLYESFNMAKIWSLPILYVIENNVYAMGTSVERSSANPKELFQRGIGFGIEGIGIDGMDFIETFNTLSQARDYVLKNGPMIIEMKTYRYKGHSMSDPAKYRSREEVENFKQQDPVQRLKEVILKKKLLNESEFTNIANTVEEEVEDCIEFALNSPEPDLLELEKNVYC